MTGDWRERARERVGAKVEADFQRLLDEADGEPEPVEARVIIGVGMPAMLKLEAFAGRIADAYGQPPFLVGSAAVSKTWRDVDVRLIVDDDVFAAMFPDHRKPSRLDLRWALLRDAISELGRQQTGLPIDFQIQAQTDANNLFGGEVRHPLGLRITG